MVANPNKTWPWPLLLVFSVLFLIPGFHHHPDLDEHEDCQICVVAHRPTIEPDVHVELPVLSGVVLATLQDASAEVAPGSRLVLRARGPPLYS